MENSAISAALAMHEAINTKQLNRINDLVTDDFVDHGSPHPVPPGPAGYIDTLRFVTEVLGITMELKELIEAPERIVLRVDAVGQGVATIHGPQAAGKPYRMDTIHIFRTQGDRLAEHWAVRDELGMLRQLGLVPVQPGPDGARS